MAGMTSGSFSECFFVNDAEYTAYASSNAEGSLLTDATNNEQPLIPAGFLILEGAKSKGKKFRFEASGVFSTTGTPTWTFQCRLGTTVGSADLSGSSLGVSTAITSASGITNKPWRLWIEFEVRIPGVGSAKTTVASYGEVVSPAGGSSASGFAAPYVYALEPSAPDTATWTQTITASSLLAFNLSVTCSASSASNTMTCKRLAGYALN